MTDKATATLAACVPPARPTRRPPHIFIFAAAALTSESLRHFHAMNVTLSKEAETCVTEVMHQLSNGRADEVVNWLILKQRAGDDYDLIESRETR